MALMLLTLATTACGLPATEVAGELVAQGSTTIGADTTGAMTTDTKTTDNAKAGSNETERKQTSECPVTIPPTPGFVATESEEVTYSKAFPAPAPYPHQYPHEGEVWYGSDGLWTALSLDGDHGGRKSVLWSTNFPGGIVEGEPKVWVTWTRLDTDESLVIDNGGKATNAYTPEEGWFMIAGIDPDQPGCWEVEATYKGASLSYVYEKTE